MTSQYGKSLDNSSKSLFDNEDRPDILTGSQSCVAVSIVRTSSEGSTNALEEEHDALSTGQRNAFCFDHPSQSRPL